MPFHKYLIIGSGIAGFHAFDELMSKDMNTDVVMVTNDKFIPYDRPPLSKEYLRGEIDRKSLFFRRAEEYRGNLVTNVSVEKITGNKAILSDGSEIEFEKALIATGGRPRRLGVPGENDRRVRYLRSLEDADAIKELARSSKKALIVGAGFIGVEVAASLTRLGIDVEVVEVKPYIWSTFVDEDMSKFFQDYFERKGVKFTLNESVKDFRGGDKIKIELTKKEIEADFALIATGIAPNVELAERSGITVNNGIVVDRQLRTNLTNVYAAGDIANIEDPITGKRRRIEHWNNAEYTGRLAARNMMGSSENYSFLSTVWSDIFDLHIESAGETTGYDEYVIRGNRDDLSFSVIYLKEGIVHGYVAVNRPGEELEALNSMIQERKETKPEKLREEDLGKN
ncbi:NAD(P)/FAD-dependent oxidoreductase [Metallosphaera hakonensis]|uniref:Pyridine nucleotide-disulfide oxidoreductase n=1 Tax=Metallosphaera hakonensis JCM 8857 = DSM 7519 TaxID=1293036 RepID=A0A2U9ISZ7_9CREN|nr:FAD/NAD(P)-binding oxidoreductase [Metallosphaera hakonensis]AWR99180.1 NAD(P)/FAD-dependent oxidoreductase [Metallosphaera hakonensis JCM 8857 = DSM 7519]